MSLKYSFVSYDCCSNLKAVFNISLFLCMYIYTYINPVDLSVDRKIGRHGGLSILCYNYGSDYQQMVLKTFPNSGYLHSEDGVVMGYIHIYIYIYIYMYVCIQIYRSPNFVDKSNRVFKSLDTRKFITEKELKYFLYDFKDTVNLLQSPL